MKDQPAPAPHAPPKPPERGRKAPIVRSVAGGALMGLANLVPGVSGGTMLLVAGVYDRVIEAVADITTLRFRRDSLIALALVVASAGVAIILLAGPVKTLVVEQRWMAYSLFIGLTLGGAPVVWRLARPARGGFFAGAVIAFALMALMALTSDASRGAAEATWWLFLLAGLVGAAAMILPGVSGGYVLLLMGAYVPVLAAIDRFKESLAPGGAHGFAISESISAGLALAPVAIGVAAGVAIVSNALRWAMARLRQPTLGALMGLLLGAVLGLWPFQQGRAPVVGEVVHGRALTPESLAALPRDDWPLAFFRPAAWQVAAALAMALAGLALTIAIDRVSQRLERRRSEAPA